MNIINGKAPTASLDFDQLLRDATCQIEKLGFKLEISPVQKYRLKEYLKKI